MKVNSSRFFLISGLLILIFGILPLGIGIFLVERQPALTLVHGNNIPYQPISFFEQTAAVVSGFIVKPTYMILSLLLIILLWKKKAIDMQLLRWGLIFFLFGEASCAINYIFFHEKSAFMEYWHSFGMVIGAGFILLALIEALDTRVIRFTDPNQKCALIGVCSGCSKYQEISCKLQQIFKFSLSALIVVSIIPLTGRPIIVSYDTTIWGTLYNFSHALIHQLYETRFSPIAAIILFIGSLVFLLFRNGNGIVVSKLLFCLGVGHLGFSFLRMVLIDSFHVDMVWFVFWEELTELILILGISFILWKFKTRLFQAV